ncbi:hypothetical protein OPV22_024210 [Ensete ventricosum]|uniref:RNase H type-1 domain-containing protein n=1 Tax=Ensete ventricosum TaxID=4639 RepID=A0AAV8QSE3_ENSVE|nr:hypothetical protein OPV22_024210 [Ensete ventricosum]
MPPLALQNPTPGWTLHIDGSANSERGGVGLVLKDPSGHVYEHALRLGFRATNNEAEYEALLFGLKVAADLGAEDIEVFTDSQLIAGQVNANGLAEVTNRAILEGLKKRVSNATTSWVEELPSVLWALRTTPKTPTGESPYSLAFGTEAVLPPEVVFSTLRIQTQSQEGSDQNLRRNLDLLEERRADAHLRALAYRRVVARIYNRRVRPQHVGTGDLVLRKTEVSDPTRSRGKLAPNWEGPYRVIDTIREGTYTLATMEGRVLSRTWHITNLRKFYV